MSIQDGKLFPHWQAPTPHHQSSLRINLGTHKKFAALSIFS